MKWTSLIFFRSAGCLLLAAVGLCSARPALGTQLYNSPGPFVVPWISPTGSPSLPSPAKVPGKEYSHDLDSTTVGAAGAPPPADAEQVVAWDGLGGTEDWKDYTGSRPLYQVDEQVDALANWYDTLFGTLRDDKAHLVFSIDDTLTLFDSEGAANPGAHVPSAGPLTLSGGYMIGGAGELSYELAGGFAAPSSMGLWAAQSDINGDTPPVDIDAVELWGPEPAFTMDDRNKYSLEVDYDSFDTALANEAVSVWNYNGTPFLQHSKIVDAVESLLGTLADAGLDDVGLINVDAMMVLSIVGDPNTFDAGLESPVHDRILFSIRQIVNPAITDADDPDRYYATGSEIFWLDATNASGYLHHGGHDWDKAFALENLLFSTEAGTGVVDLNAIEAVAVVPEPSTALLGLTVIAILGWWSRRRKTSSVIA